MAAGARFITFEGGEGTGKSTQARRLVKRLNGEKIPVVATREPGGSPGGEQIRALLVSGDADRWSSLAETLLFYAARDDHLRTTVRPALSGGRWVVCDRFSDSTRAYQSLAGGAGSDLVDRLEQAVVRDTVPDLTLILDIDPHTGLARAAARAGQNDARFESKTAAYHQTVREAFLSIADRARERCVVIDAGGPMADIEREIWAIVHARFLKA